MALGVVMLYFFAYTLQFRKTGMNDVKKQLKTRTSSDLWLDSRKYKLFADQVKEKGDFEGHHFWLCYKSRYFTFYYTRK